jgi:hypothetical protein
VSALTPYSCTLRRRSLLSKRARCADALLRARSVDAITISLTASLAPADVYMRRRGAAVMPAMGAASSGTCGSGDVDTACVARAAAGGGAPAGRLPRCRRTRRHTHSERAHTTATGSSDHASTHIKRDMAAKSQRQDLSRLCRQHVPVGLRHQVAAAVLVCCRR